MKKMGIIIVIYIVLAVIISAIAAKPKEIDERAFAKHIDTYMPDTSEFAETYNLPENFVEEARQGAIDNVRNLYEYKNSFRYRFIRNLWSAGLGLIIIVVTTILIGCDARWRRWRYKRGRGWYW